MRYIFKTSAHIPSWESSSNFFHSTGSARMEAHIPEIKLSTDQGIASKYIWSSDCAKWLGATSYRAASAIANLTRMGSFSPFLSTYASIPLPFQYISISSIASIVSGTSLQLERTSSKHEKSMDQYPRTLRRPAIASMTALESVDRQREARL